MYVVKALFHKVFTIIQHFCKIEFLNVFRNLELWNEDISSDVTNIRFNGAFLMAGIWVTESNLKSIMDSKSLKHWIFFENFPKSVSDSCCIVKHDNFWNTAYVF